MIWKLNVLRYVTIDFIRHNLATRVRVAILDDEISYDYLQFESLWLLTLRPSRGSTISSSSSARTDGKAKNRFKNAMACNKRDTIKYDILIRGFYWNDEDSTRYFHAFFLRQLPHISQQANYFQLPFNI